MLKTEELWSELEACFTCRKATDYTPLNAITRIIQEDIDRTLQEITPNNCDLREEYVSLGNLRKFIRRHSKCNPRSENGALIALEHANSFYIIDGNNRLNKWLNQPHSPQQECRIIVIKYKAAKN